MSNAPDTISALIDKWPTIAEFSAEVGCGYEAARQMRLRNSISPRHWPAVIGASATRGVDGVSAEWLMKQHAANAEAAE